jgi:hypothetical protein
MIEFPEKPAEFRLVRMIGFDADPGEPVENSEFLFAQSFVDDESVLVLRKPCRVCDYLGGLSRAEVWGRQDDVGAAVFRKRGKPATECFRLLFAKLGERHVDVAHIEIDHAITGKVRGFASYIAG